MKPWGAILRFVGRRPFTFGLVVVVLGIAFATGGPFGPPRGVHQLAGTGYQAIVDRGQWWAPLTSALATDGIGMLVIAVVGVIVLVGAAERLMGGVRTAIAFVVTAYVGTAAGLGLQFAGVTTGEHWARGVRHLFALDPLTPVVGTIMTASSFAGPLWRRRIRVVVLLGVTLMLLYSGQPSDLYRLCAALVGPVLGRLYRPRPIQLGWVRSSHREARTLLASVVAVLALGPVITVFSGATFGPLAPLGLLLTSAASGRGDFTDRCLAGSATGACLQELALERTAGVGPVLVTLLPLVALLLAAYGLLRGRRFAGWLAIVINVALAALAAYFYGFLPVSGQPHVVTAASGRYWEVALSLFASTTVPLVAAVLIAGNLRHLPGRTPRRTVWHFAVTVGVALVSLSALYLGVGWLLRDGFQPSVTFLDLLADLPERFVPVGFLGVERSTPLPSTPVTATLYQWVGPAFWVTVIVAAMFALRIAPVPGRHDERGRMLGILRRGGSSLSYMTTWEGNLYWFSADGTTYIAYRVINTVAITTSDPVGPRAPAERAVREFATFCDDHGWVPVFYSVHDDWEEFFHGLGWQTIPVGEETFVYPQTWTTDGPKSKDVRTSVNRAARAGLRAEWASFRSLPLGISSQITALSERWVAERNLPEMGFTLGGLDELRDGAVRLMVALDADDEVQAVTSWLPTFRDGVVVGWTLDFMRRQPDGMNGAMEFIIAKTVERMRDDPNIEFLSLSAAPLAQSSPTPDGRLGPRVLGFMGAALEPAYGFRSLFAFKRKFQPELRPLLMAYPDPAALPAVGLALARAYLRSGSDRDRRRPGAAAIPATVPEVPEVPERPVATLDAPVVEPARRR